MPMIEKAADAVLYDLRGRKLLKYLFAEDWLQRAAYGYVDEPIEGDVQQEIAQSLVRAVLLAIREPTKPVIDAGITAASEVEDWTRDSYESYRVDDASDMPLPVWQAMIDKALEEEG